MPLIFQYGSNCDTARLNDKDRLAGAVEDLGRAQTVGEYCIAFDVWSQGNGCAVSDLVAAPGTAHRAWGVLYNISEAAFEKLKHIEGKRYEPKAICVRDKGWNEVVEPVTTFLVKVHERRKGLWTSAEYVGHVVKGLRDHDAPGEYVQHVIEIALQTNRLAVDAASELGTGLSALPDCAFKGGL